MTFVAAVPLLIFPAVCLLLALLLGGWPERTAATIAICASLLTSVVTITTWQTLEVKILLIDIFVLIGFWTISFNSDRFWPYWVTAWQLITVMTHMESVISSVTHTYAYAYIATLLSLPISALIAGAAIMKFSNNRSI